MSLPYCVVATLLAACVAVVDGYVETPLNSVARGAPAGASVDLAYSEMIVYPYRYQHTANGPDFHYYTSNLTCLTLTPSAPTATFDYRTEVGGYPFLDAASLSGSDAVQIEAKYSEAKRGLDEPFADGPWTFSNGLANSFRVETFNITRRGHVESFFQQGGQRWQRLRLLNNNTTVRLCGVGIRSLNERTEVEQLPGYFASSNRLYNEIWALGARTVQQACIEKGTAPTTWEVTSDGVLLRGQQSAQSALGASLANYTMTFRTKIVRGGIGWRVATSLMGYGLTLLLTSEYPAHSTFLNTNRTLVPPSTLAVGYGFNIVNQTTLTTGRVFYFPLSFDVKEGEWLRISTQITPKSYIISINNQTTIAVPLDGLQVINNAQFSSGSVYAGSWGFGPYQDQLAYVKDVAVHAQNSSLLYYNAMNDDSVLEEYGVSTNPASVCLDGAKRDRLVWSGDFAHTQRIVSASTNRSDLVKGTLEFILDRQEESGPNAGLFAMSPGMGQAARYASVYKSYGLLDYQMLFLNSLARYYLDSADIKFIRGFWEKIKAGVEAMIPLINDASGLATACSLGIFFVGDSNGTAASALLAYTLTRMAEVAELVGEPKTASQWKERATDLSFAVNQKLWNKSLGTYSSSLTGLNESSLIGTAWAILSNTANTSQADSSIAALSTLRLGIGYKTTSDTTSDPSTNLSPNLSGFLLEALFKHARGQPYHAATVEAIDFLLNGLWAAMIDQDDYYTGTSWEYLYPDGRPGLDLFTSHAHPWGGAPTYVFTEYLLGIQPTSPGFMEWAFRPVITGMGLSWVEGRVPTPRGIIKAGWAVENGTEVRLHVCAPAETRGIFVIPLSATKCLINNRVQLENCGESGVQVNVRGGKCSHITVFLADSTS
ncbi:Six-hairpin glycosidase-like protein [Aspergillus similis]